jgi:GT2 family glycosyltransferase
VRRAPRVAVVIVTYRSAAQVAGVLQALVGQLDDDDELIVVDNASDDGTADAVRAAAPRARVLEQRANLGFATGCAIGAAASSAELIWLLNPDAPPAPGCVDALRRAAAEHPEWGAWQALVTLPGGERVNTSGNVVHFLGFGWAGGCGTPVPDHPRDGLVGFASGAAMVIRREAWDAAGGFDERYFMYGEDLDLSLRLRLLGWEVGVASAARVTHDYEFRKGQRKWYLMDRNRWSTILADYPTPLLVRLLPALVAFELALLPVAARDGWLIAKLRSQAAVARSLPALLRRRRRVQARPEVSASAFATSLTSTLDSPYLSVPSWASPLVRGQHLYWRWVLAALT